MGSHLATELFGCSIVRYNIDIDTMFSPSSAPGTTGSGSARGRTSPGGQMGLGALSRKHNVPHTESMLVAGQSPAETGAQTYRAGATHQAATKAAL